MKKLVKILERMLRSLPSAWTDCLYEVVLAYIPIILLRKIPCSYSTYLECYTPKAGDIIVDAGAHIGNCSLLFSRMVGDNGCVIAMEPFSDSYAKLVDRVKRLKLHNVIPVNKGLYHEDTMLSMRVFTDTTLGANIANEVDKEIAGDVTEIQCVRLDTLVHEMGLKHLELVKMDIEGAEIEALMGATVVMDKLKPCFSIASYHIREGVKTHHALEKFLTEHGYQATTFFPPHLTTCGKFIR